MLLTYDLFAPSDEYPKESNGNQDQTEPPRSSLSPPQLVISELCHGIFLICLLVFYTFSKKRPAARSRPDLVELSNTPHPCVECSTWTHLASSRQPHSGE
jgi:hypothetical protein